MKVKTKLDSNKLSSKSIVGGKLLNLNRVLQVYFLHNNSNNAKYASSDLIGPRRKISIFSRGNSLARVKVIKPPAFDTEHETTTTDDDIKRRMIMQPGLIDYLWTSLKEKYRNIPAGTLNALKKTQFRMSKQGRQKAKRRNKSGKYYNQTVSVYAMHQKRKNKIKNVERVLGVVEPEAVASRTRKKKSKTKTTTKVKTKEVTIKPAKLKERTGATEPDLDWVNRHYVRIVGTFPRNEREFALARLQKQSHRFVLARIGYRGPNAGLRGTKATVITWGGVPANTTCSCPYDFCTCKGNPIGSNSQYPCGVLKCDLWGGFVKFFSWLGLGSLVARIRKKPATFGPSLIRAVGAAKRSYMKAGGKGDEIPPDTCLTGCHAFYRRDFDDGLKKRKKKKTKVIVSDEDDTKKKKEVVLEKEEEQEEEEKHKKKKKKKVEKPKPPPEVKIIVQEKEVADANRLEILRLEDEARKAADELAHADKCKCCKFCVGTEMADSEMSSDPCFPQQPCYGAGYGPHPLDPSLSYGMPPCAQGPYGQQQAYAAPPPYGPYGSAQLLYDQQQVPVKKRVTYEDDTTTEESEDKYAPPCQGQCALHAKPRPTGKPQRPKEWCGPDCNCGSILCAMRRIVSTHLVTPCTCPSERNPPEPEYRDPDDQIVRQATRSTARVTDGTQNSTENKNVSAQPRDSRSTGTTGPGRSQGHGTGTDKHKRKNAKL